MNNYGTKNTHKYCAFYDQNGHDIADCRQLKDQIEDLIRNGKLTEWVVREVRKHNAKSGGIGYHRVPRVGSIHMIMGGKHLGGTSKKAMERYAREAKGQALTNVMHLTQRPPKRFKGETYDITFTEEDAQWVYHPHSDSLVIKVGIRARNVNRVLCDCGSIVNILERHMLQPIC